MSGNTTSMLGEIAATLVQDKICQVNFKEKNKVVDKKDPGSNCPVHVLGSDEYHYLTLFGSATCCRSKTAEPQRKSHCASS